MDADSMYPQGYHPVQRKRLPVPNWSSDAPHYSRASAPRPVRYYFTDFGLSTHLAPGAPRLVTGGLGAKRDVPELSDTIPYDPFKLDIFVLGNVFKSQIHDKYFRVEVLGPLIAAMMQRSPAARPTAQEALQRWRHIRTRVSVIQRASRLRGRDETLVYTVLFDILSFIKVVYVIAKKFTGWSLSWLSMIFT
ncbi:uncharacterized protein PHACADRAFT_265616 [Phanerochaete carnosa HHB-10118-sp]|uniref:Protein kinase domain-containing protein n=1 Tax=Phanerochaete carnosa (strain HHB-10118-sp) TaxID=650164 RepID=K5UJY2_PHACS|nr:uncharacterized protein PHACADRAFT_265616 [Phanerochaete carnosa HHB-10118-sp]EKM49866.1 hypothetical protein PHACADRAFT_265616 [Phanerochaete carnosa HHB-10118-sp]